MPGVDTDAIVPVHDPEKLKKLKINQISAKKTRKKNSPMSRSMGAGVIKGLGEPGECLGLILTL